jgi:uncharacterized membrane protein AbrB (regulator of aidB expression)
MVAPVILVATVLNEHNGKTIQLTKWASHLLYWTYNWKSGPWFTESFSLKDSSMLFIFDDHASQLHAHEFVEYVTHD